MLKVQRGMCPSIFSDNVHRHDVYKYLWNHSHFAVPNAKSSFQGSKGIPYLLSRMNDNVINELTELSILEDFETRTKNKKLKIACRVYVRN